MKYIVWTIDDVAVFTSQAQAWNYYASIIDSKRQARFEYVREQTDTDHVGDA